jgi:hypothetical protein
VLADLLGLHPADPVRTGGTGGTGTGSDESVLGLVGDVGHPRFLVPLDHPPASAAALLAYNRLRPLRTRLTRAAVAGTARVGLDRFTLAHRFRVDTGPGSFIAHLADLLHTPDLQVAVGVANVDQVWKPTVQCFTPDGEPVAYAKAGVGPVGAHLVSRERPVLEAWAAADDPRLVVPGLVATTTWQGHPVICCEPMPADVRRLPVGPVSAWPVRLLDPPEADRPLHAATWWTDRVADHGDHPVVGPLLDAVAGAHDGPDRAWARWHGDWVPWNLARSRRGLVAWDWEYSEPGAPVGLDEVHGAYQQARFQHHRPVADAVTAARRTAADPWVADAQLVALATRHALLHQLAGEPVGDHHEVMAQAQARASTLRSGLR